MRAYLQGRLRSWGWWPHAVGPSTSLHLFFREREREKESERESHAFLGHMNGSFQDSFKTALQAPQLCMSLQRVFSCKAWSLGDGVGSQVPHPMCVCVCTGAYMRVCMCGTLNLLNWHYRTKIPMSTAEWINYQYALFAFLFMWSLGFSLWCRISRWLLVSRVFLCFIPFVFVLEY